MKKTGKKNGAKPSESAKEQVAEGAAGKAMAADSVVAGPALAELTEQAVLAVETESTRVPEAGQKPATKTKKAVAAPSPQPDGQTATTAVPLRADSDKTVKRRPKAGKTSTPADKMVEKESVALTRAKPEKRVQRAVVLAGSEHRQLRSLRRELKKAGHAIRRSQLVRAAVAALVTRSGPDVAALVAALPAVTKGKAGRKAR